ncbi:MAG: hypothetical protein ACK551_04030 [Vampirovibrionales bacterium]
MTTTHKKIGFVHDEVDLDIITEFCAEKKLGGFTSLTVSHSLGPNHGLYRSEYLTPTSLYTFLVVPAENAKELAIDLKSRFERTTVFVVLTDVETL